ncbi:hypothetical protein AQUCO_01200130v1 [Aquilegia coerulea]|uniref:AAA+ ATPase domain-containing protein n=1 Tax=Aquilegia coerulea TaxID=218851 RepID=A0A2G5E573_AQUCA|nr:hypothetical protein AQUCO_01200130v1 [Aquilegia coerulea]
MAESVVSLVVERLGGLIIQEVSFLKKVHEQFERLQKELISIQGFLKTVDSYHNQDPCISTWVADVRDIAYDVDEVIDAFLKVASEEDGKGSNILKQIGCKPKNIFKLHNLGKEIEKVFFKLEDISQRRQRYGITNMAKGTISSTTNEMLLRRSYPHAEDDATIGLEDQTCSLVAELLKEEDRLCVVSIYGMGGLGKTTLAKKVYNHCDVKTHFDCYAWTSISQHPSIGEVLQEILRKVSALMRTDTREMNEVELVEQLFAILEEKRYLVVLDDIWSKEAWNILQPAFPNNRGSKVMLTTRNVEVAMHADRWSQHLQPRYLTDEEAWDLVCRKAFPHFVHDTTQSLSSDLEDCGRNMVKRCGGLPLEIIVLGGILASKKSLNEWETVSQHLGIFNTSQRLFPEDFHIPVKKLVYMWMAESMIRQENERETIEKVGSRYLDELIHRCMVQIGEKSLRGRVKICRLHDKMRDLSIAIGREEDFFEVISRKNNSSSSTNDSSSSSSGVVRNSNKLRRCAIYIEKDIQYVFPKYLTPCLRSAIFVHDEPFYYCASIVCKDFKLLKVLEFEDMRFVNSTLEKEFCRVLGKLSNLRYLSLRNTKLQKIPKSIGNLVFLQTLDLRLFYSLAIPNVVWKMRQLRHLYGWFINGFSIDTLTELRTLSVIAAACWAMDQSDQLRSLYLTTRKGFSDLKRLSGKRHLLKLKLIGRLTKFPFQWPSNLIKLSICDAYLSEDPMPILEKLQHLLRLELAAYSYSGKEMVCSGKGFSQLQHLEVSNLYQLEEWTVEEGAMPCLVTCMIQKCWNLKLVPPGFKFFTILQELKIFNMCEFYNVRVKEGGLDWHIVQHIPSIIVKGSL